MVIYQVSHLSEVLVLEPLGFHPCNVDERLSRGRFGRVSRATGVPVVSMSLPVTGMGALHSRR